MIGSSGLLGDRFVEVRPKVYDKNTPDSQKAAYVQDGDVIEGQADIGLPEIMEASKPLIDPGQSLTLPRSLMT